MANKFTILCSWGNNSPFLKHLFLNHFYCFEWAGDFFFHKEENHAREEGIGRNSLILIVSELEKV